ncbi:MAG: carbohydrate binding domain-containing protein, partial [Promicromonosporaceae bacterium]|nr:carbohydrate binding domain-containing protein [Promicromonosporaceae bacterium]
MHSTKKRWQRLSALGATAALVASGLIGLAAPAAADAEAPNQVLRITQTADWNGLQIPASYITPGGTYRLEARALADEFYSGTVRFVTQTDENGFDWINSNTTVNDEAWTNLSATFTARATGIDHIRLVGGAPGTFYVDDVVVTRVVADGDDVEVLRLDFDTLLPSWGPPFGDGGTFAIVDDPLWSAPPAPANYVQQVETSANWNGPQVDGALLEVGATYHFSARVLGNPLAASFGNAVWQGAAGSFAWLTPQVVAMSADEWQTVAGTIHWTEALTAQENIRLTSNVVGTWFVDDVLVVRTHDADGVELAEPVVIWDFDFQGENAATTPGNGTFTIVRDPLHVDEGPIDEEPLPRLADTLYYYADGVRHYIPFGTAIDARETTGDSGDLVLDHFSSVVLENHMKPDSWFAGAINATSFERIPADAVGTRESTGLRFPGTNFRVHPTAVTAMDFAADNGLGMFGHVM